MFEIKCIVADKKVVEVLHLLDGHTLEPPVALPIRGAAVANGHHAPKTKAKSWTTAPGGSVNILQSFVKGRKKVAVKEMRMHLVEQGYSPNGYSYALQSLTKDGFLKKTKEPGVYEVVR